VSERERAGGADDEDDDGEGGGGGGGGGEGGRRGWRVRGEEREGAARAFDEHRRGEAARELEVGPGFMVT
jgi:hypothetical protein